MWGDGGSYGVCGVICGVLWGLWGSYGVLWSVWGAWLPLDDQVILLRAGELGGCPISVVGWSMGWPYGVPHDVGMCGAEAVGLNLWDLWG